MVTAIQTIHSFYNVNPNCEPNTTILSKGKYLFELWGASGGGEGGGKGAFASGVIAFQKETELYIYVGGQGEGLLSGNNNADGGCNGGGKGGQAAAGYGTGCGGGGSSDIRIDSDDHNNRIIVAGGGGGSCSDGLGDGGAAGRMVGHDSGGAKISLGGGQENCSIFFQGEDGRDSVNYSSLGAQGGGGGGGGWYGGCTYKYSGTQTNSGGGGGSSYISGYPGFDENDKYVFSHYNLFDGTEYFLSPQKEMELGHSGDGFIRISLLQIFCSNNRKTIKSIYYVFVIILSNKN